MSTKPLFVFLGILFAFFVFAPQFADALIVFNPDGTAGGTYNFGSTPVGTPVLRDFRVRNNDGAVSTVNVNASGAYSCIANCSLTLNNGQERAVSIRFNPTLAQNYPSSIAFNSSFGDVFRSVTGTGTGGGGGVTPDLQITVNSPTNVGTMLEGTTPFPEVSIDIQNVGDPGSVLRGQVTRLSGSTQWSCIGAFCNYSGSGIAPGNTYTVVLRFDTNGASSGGSGTPHDTDFVFSNQNDSSDNEVVTVSGNLTNGGGGGGGNRSIQINGGAATTNTSNVTLNLTCTPGPSCAQMRFSSDGIFWGSAEPFSGTKAWTLSSGDGNKTVFVQFSPAGGGSWSSSVSDSITLDTSGGGGLPTTGAPVPSSVVVPFANPLGVNSFSGLINNLIDFLFTISIIVAPILLVIAGIIFMTAAGDPSRVATARRMLLWTIIGFGLILISKGLVTVLQAILGI